MVLKVVKLIIFLIKGSEPEMFYETKIKYTCKPGSQFLVGNNFRKTRVLECLWKKSWEPATLPECKVTHCVKPTTPLASLNYNFTWDNQEVLVDNYYTYYCDSDKALESDTRNKSSASNSISVKCNSLGDFEYPEIWPQCFETISCGSPPHVPINGTREWVKGAVNDDKYDTHITYKCAQGSMFDTNNNDVGNSVNVTINCEWRKVWNPWPKLPKCVITHCIDPLPMPEDSNLEELNSDWVPINEKKWYQCKGIKPDGNHTKFFESDRNKSSFSMLCKPDGTYDFINIRENWPTCLSNVNCGQPPNVTNGGSRTWLNGIELKDTYATQVKYQCVKGSQFDTNGDLEGDSESITTVCRWNKNWSPWSTLPQCYITHCVDPFYIPLYTSLEESTSEFPRINSNKEYRCSKRSSNGVHTKFFLHDRSKSSFSMPCLPNGTFGFLNKTENWPVCVEGKLHLYIIRSQLLFNFF